VFALSSADQLSGSSGADLFVFAQPIANDTIHNFNAAADKIDLSASRSRWLWRPRHR
jgi:Ca2+-binding RTX toxin-like protein